MSDYTEAERVMQHERKMHGIPALEARIRELEADAERLLRELVENRPATLMRLDGPRVKLFKDALDAAEQWLAEREAAGAMMR